VPALIAIAMVYGIQLIYEGRLFEGVLLMVVGVTAGFYAEYLIERYTVSDVGLGWLRMLQGFTTATGVVVSTSLDGFDGAWRRLLERPLEGL
jgi:hypothetical protein